MSDAIVVGAGLFGGTIARALRAEGRDVVVLDDGRPLSGSKPSGCLMKPGWFSGMGKEIYEPSLALIERVYGITELPFTVWPTGITTKVMRASANIVPEHVRDRVTSVLPGRVWTAGRVYEAPLVVVAAGIWCQQLMDVPGLHGKQGVSFSTPGQVNPFIRPWAPYKQVVAFNESADRIWIGDGSAIKPENWTEERQSASLNRCANALNRPNLGVEVRLGIRPFVKQKPCLLEEREPGFWLATGGGKNGLVAAGWCAHRILEAS